MPRRKVIRAELASKHENSKPRAEQVWAWVVAISTAFVVLVFKIHGCQYDQARRAEQRWHEEHPYGVSWDEKKFTPNDLDAYYRKGTSR